MSARARASLLAGLTLAAFAVFTALALAPSRASAQEPDWNRADDPLYESLGLHAGKLGGTGLAFKFPIQWWLYGQAAGGIWHTGGDKRHNAGFMLQYILRQDRVLRLYVAAGVGYYHHSHRVTVLGSADQWATQNNWNLGFGVGAELLRGERWSLQADADFTHEGEDGSIILFPQIGAFYYF